MSIYSETAERADDLPECCGTMPMRVTKADGRCYVECGRCRAHTVPDTMESASRQWRAMHNARNDQALLVRKVARIGSTNPRIVA